MRALRPLAPAILGALLLAPPLAAQIPEMPMGKWWKRPRVVETLHLTPDQQERLEEIFAKSRRGFVDLKAEVERRQIDVEELMTKKDSDPKKVSAAVDALDQARLRLGKARTMMVVEMKQILTAEQWQLIIDRMQEFRRERMEDRMLRRQERHGSGGAGGGTGGPGGPPGATPPREQVE